MWLNHSKDSQLTAGHWGEPRADPPPRGPQPEVPPLPPPHPPLPLLWGGPWSAAVGYGSWCGPAGPAPSPGRAACRVAGPLSRGLVVGSAGAERLRVPPAAVGQHAVGAARPGARPRPRAQARRSPLSAAAAPRGPRGGGQGQAQTRARTRTRAAAGTRPGLGRPHSIGNPAADFRAAGGGRWTHALPRQVPLATGCSGIAQADRLPPRRWQRRGQRRKVSAHARVSESAVSHGVQLEPQGPHFDLRGSLCCCKSCGLR